MQRDAAHVVLCRPESSQGFDLDQCAVLKHAANAKFIIVGLKVRQLNRGYLAI